MDKERNIILDCDTGEDDALAILVALQNRLPLNYIITSYGNTSIFHSTDNTSKILSYTDNLGVKVVKGSSKSLETHLLNPAGETASELIGENGLCGLELPLSKIKNIIEPDEKEFPEFLSDLIKSQVPTDYIITGPSTNFAKACDFLKSSIKDYVRNVYIMGGAIHTPGNTGPINSETGMQNAEFNFYCDPNAINIVLSSGLPIHLVTWDITSNLTVPLSQVEGLTAKNSVGEFTISLIKHFFGSHKNDPQFTRSFELNDPITVMAKLGYGRFKEERIKVITNKNDYGRSVWESNGYPVKYFYLEENEKPEIIEAVLRTLDLAHK